ncbi:MAG: gliding motility-associated C-terminal domain-containing protein [Bacteroidetes bacterium]|nr:gliding motility-associated C-terminal domain-containing protein [Bacteroidota bacterium]
MNKLFTFLFTVKSALSFSQQPPIIPNPSPKLPTRDIINTSFEIPPVLNPTGVNIIDAANSSSLNPMLGWQSTHPINVNLGSFDHPIEVWGSGALGVSITTGGGNQFVELNAEDNSALYQDVCLTAGDTIVWTAFHRGRGSATLADTAEFFISDPNQWAAGTIVYTGVKLYSKLLITSSNASVTNGIASTGGWAKHGDVWICNVTGTYRISFQSIGTGSGNNTIGNFLDLISISVKPQVTFLPTDLTNRVNIPQIEEDSIYYLSLAVSGTTSSPATVIITLDASSTLSVDDFTIGTKYSGSGGNVISGVISFQIGNDIIMTIPPYAFNINDSLHYITISLHISDTIPEPNETAIFTITQVSGGGDTFGLYNLIKGNACMLNAQDQVQITVIDNDNYKEPEIELLVPNVFTPNGDAKNDLFTIKNKGIKEYDLKIYNRWGILVFETNDSQQHWNGIIMNNGNNASDGTYYYLLNTTDIKETTKQHTGYLQLIR